MTTGELKLVLKFRLGGESDLRVQGASRISVDGRRGLTLTDPQTGRLETIPLSSIEFLSIQALSYRRRPQLVV